MRMQSLAPRIRVAEAAVRKRVRRVTRDTVSQRRYEATGESAYPTTDHNYNRGHGRILPAGRDGVSGAGFTFALWRGVRYRAAGEALGDGRAWGCAFSDYDEKS